MGGFALLLLLGTDLVNWRWLAALPAAGLAAGAFRACRRQPTAYRTAQLLDERLHLADTLSTAIFFWRRQLPRGADEDMRLRQRGQAIAAASTVDFRMALPMRIPRTVLFSFVVLTLLATGLVWMHYRVDGTLDLRRPAFEAIRQWERQVAEEIAQIQRSPHSPEHERVGGGERLNSDSGDPEHSGSEEAGPGPREKSDAEARGNDTAEKTDRPENHTGEGGQESQSGGSRQGEADRAAASGEAASPQQEPQPSSQKAGQPGTGSSLLSKLSNSLANLASALKSTADSASAARRGQDPASGNNRESAKRAGTFAASNGDSAAAQTRASEAKDDSSANMGADANSGRSGPTTDERGGNGAGSDNGNKDIKLANQLEAMGKISVILGKRSQAITGNATVEVTSGRSELKTAYETREANHGEVAASNERDRIPIEFEAYVQQYFRELRKHTERPRQKK
jgi:hypothetical protein